MALLLPGAAEDAGISGREVRAEVIAAMVLPLVVGIDGSAAGLRAVEWAAGEAALTGSPLRLVHGSPWRRYEQEQPTTATDRPDEEVFIEELVGVAYERATHIAADVEVTTDIRPAEAVPALLFEAHHAAAVIVATRGRGPLRAMLLGSVGLALAGRAPCPVIVVRGDVAGRGSPSRKIVLGVGDSPGACEAARFAFREAAVRDCPLVVVRAWQAPTAGDEDGDMARAFCRQAAQRIDTVVRTARGDYSGVQVERRILRGGPHEVLVEASAGADLVVLAAKRRKGPTGPQLGTVSRGVLRHAACPVAVVPERHGASASLP